MGFDFTDDPVGARDLHGGPGPATGAASATGDGRIGVHGRAGPRRHGRVTNQSSRSLRSPVSTSLPEYTGRRTGMSRQDPSIHRGFAGHNPSAGRISPQQSPPRHANCSFVSTLAVGIRWASTAWRRPQARSCPARRSQDRPRGPGRPRIPRTGSSPGCATGSSRHRPRYTRSPQSPSGPGLPPTISFS